jgi:hypothetical protein
MVHDPTRFRFIHLSFSPAIFLGHIHPPFPICHFPSAIRHLLLFISLWSWGTGSVGLILPETQEIT